MKNVLSIALSLLLIMVLASACKSTKNVADKAKENTTKGSLTAKIAKSKIKWLRLKKQWKDHYTYVTTFTSGEGGFTVKKFITVKSGEVVNAVEHLTKFDTSDEEKKTQKKVLSSEQISKLKTMDEIYAFAAETLTKQSPKENHIAFSVFSNGIISAAGYTPRLCADDCYRGYTIEKISPEK